MEQHSQENHLSREQVRANLEREKRQLVAPKKYDTEGNTEKPCAFVYLILPTGKIDPRAHVVLPDRAFVFGRQKDSNILIGNKYVSRIHATVTYDSSTKSLMITDSSTHGTWINDTRLVSHQRTPLRMDDIVVIAGKSFLFVDPASVKALEKVPEEPEPESSYSSSSPSISSPSEQDEEKGDKVPKDKTKSSIFGSFRFSGRRRPEEPADLDKKRTNRFIHEFGLGRSQSEMDTSSASWKDTLNLIDTFQTLFFAASESSKVIGTEPHTDIKKRLEEEMPPPLPMRDINEMKAKALNAVQARRVERTRRLQVQLKEQMDRYYELYQTHEQFAQRLRLIDYIGFIVWSKCVNIEETMYQAIDELKNPVEVPTAVAKIVDRPLRSERIKDPLAASAHEMFDGRQHEQPGVEKLLYEVTESGLADAVLKQGLDLEHMPPPVYHNQFSRPSSTTTKTTKGTPKATNNNHNSGITANSAIANRVE